MPARVVLQDFTGVPCVVDLVAMRDAMARMKGNPDVINPVVPCDLVIDHSVQVDYYGTGDAFKRNVDLEFERNRERYQLLKFAQRAFRNFSVVPPGTGIVHQVNLEYLAPVVQLRPQYGELTAYPDSLVGTDSHTTMINGLGVLGWGVGGIEAEAVMLGQPYFMLIPDVIGMKLTGELPLGTTATDLVLTVTQILRKKGVVDKFVEFYGPGLSSLGLADRATIANMAPEYGATMGFFPVDAETVRYLERTGRDPAVVARVERYCKEQGLFRTDATPDPVFTDTLDAGPRLGGPRARGSQAPAGPGAARRSQAELPGVTARAAHAGGSRGATRGGRRPTTRAGSTRAAAATIAVADSPAVARTVVNGEACELHDGSVVIAAITSCTNTSNPSVMIGAGLLAQEGGRNGDSRLAPWVKTSLAPGLARGHRVPERVGTAPVPRAASASTWWATAAPPASATRGPLPEPIAQAIDEHALVTAAVLSGNRNFEARVHPQVRANYLASPDAGGGVRARRAGRHRPRRASPLGTGKDGKPVFLKDIWPSPQEIAATMAASLKPRLFRERYASVFEGDDVWRALPVP